MTKQEKLDEIAKEIAICEICRKDTSGKAVPGEGNADAEIVFVGEAPGKTEAKTGRPFIGRSGQLLRKFIKEAGLKENRVFITSPVKYLPIRGTPSISQVAHGRVHLLAQLEVIEPKIIVLLGSVACQAVLEVKIPILKKHGNVIEKNGQRYLISIHPAAVLRFPKYKKLMAEDFKKLRMLAY